MVPEARMQKRILPEHKYQKKKYHLEQICKYNQIEIVEQFIKFVTFDKFRDEDETNLKKNIKNQLLRNVFFYVRGISKRYLALGVAGA